MGHICGLKRSEQLTIDNDRRRQDGMCLGLLSIVNVREEIDLYFTISNHHTRSKTYILLETWS